MRITFQHEKIRRISSGLLELSRMTRQTGYELDDILRELHWQTGFDACRQEIRRQEETLSLLTAYLVTLSSALNEIAELYGRAESQNAERLEDASGLYRAPAPGTVRQDGADTRARMERILYR